MELIFQTLWWLVFNTLVVTEDDKINSSDSVLKQIKHSTFNTQHQHFSHLFLDLCLGSELHRCSSVKRKYIDNTHLILATNASLRRSSPNETLVSTASQSLLVVDFSPDSCSLSSCPVESLPAFSLAHSDASSLCVMMINIVLLEQRIT